VIQPERASPDEKTVWEVPLREGVRYLINPGSAGQPRDDDPRAAFGVFDTERSVMEFYRVPYDVKTAQDKILEAQLPPRLAQRLATGR
jgi:diadenosine tetraphosphatase ApaH/serine/threonine PP2A family protein phosphatase